MSHCESLKGISHLSNLKFLELKMIGKWHESGPTDDEMDEAHPDDDSPNHLWDEGDGGWDEEDEGGFGEEQEGGWDEEDGGFDEHVDQEWPDDYDFDDEEGHFEEDPFEGTE